MAEKRVHKLMLLLTSRLKGVEQSIITVTVIYGVRRIQHAKGLCLVKHNVLTKL